VEGESSRTSAEYIEWLATEVGRDYRVANGSDSSVGFAKQVEGDAFYLKIDVEQ